MKTIIAFSIEKWKLDSYRFDNIKEHPLTRHNKRDINILPSLHHTKIQQSYFIGHLLFFSTIVSIKQ